MMSPVLALLSTLTGSNYPCLELICMVPRVFEPFKFDCINFTVPGLVNKFVAAFALARSKPNSHLGLLISISFKLQTL